MNATPAAPYRGGYPPLCLQTEEEVQTSPHSYKKEHLTYMYISILYYTYNIKIFVIYFS